jgi:hypothetical protein
MNRRFILLFGRLYSALRAGEVEALTAALVCG